MDVALRKRTFHLQEDLEGLESQEDPGRKKPHKSTRPSRFQSQCVTKELLTLSPTGPLGPIGPDEPCRQQQHTGSHRQEWCYEGCVRGFLQEVLEDQPGLFVLEDRALQPPLCCPRKE